MVQNSRADRYPRFSDDEFQRRYDAVHQVMADNDLDALVVYSSSEVQCSNIHYLTNYIGQFHNYLVVFADPDEDPTLFVGLTNHTQYADEVSIVDDVRWGEFPPMDTVVDRIRTTPAASGRIGLVGVASRFDILIPHGHYETLEADLDAELVDATAEYGQIQQIKSDEEIESIRRGAEHADTAMDALASQAEPGMTEYELKRIVESSYTGDGGSPGVSFISTASMTDPEPGACYPWKDKPSGQTVESGDVITTELSASSWGYSGQIHRPLAVGTAPTEEYETIFDVVADVHDDMLDQLRPGNTAQDIVDAVAPITAAGYRAPDAILHGYGMSLGPPWIGTTDSNYWPNRDDPHTVPDGEFEFEENMVVVIQPNAVTQDGRYGLQFGSTVLITDTGPELLTTYPLEFIEV